MEPTFIDAIKSLAPNVTFSWEGTTVIEWDVNETEIDQPTEAEINAKLVELKTEYNVQKYARNRASDYPSTGDQLDMMYKDTKNSTTTHAAAVEAVKTKWPKDNSGPV